MKMKKLTILICVLAILVAFTGVASASPAQPTKFRIKGHTTIIDLTEFPFSIASEGKVIKHIQGTFTMNETLIPDFEDPTRVWNSGTLMITTKKGDEMSIGFAGYSTGETVQGNFWVTGGDGAYEDLTGGGTYAGITDTCDVCNPFTDPDCNTYYFYMPDCDGFYVDFTFTD
jgi:hypothetical protein